jgi:hypothetical protein
MRLDSRFLVLTLVFSTAMAFGSAFAFAQAKTNRGSVSLEALVAEGYEIKGMERGQDQAPFIVLLQRGTDVKSCILRIRRNPAAVPTRESICF